MRALRRWIACNEVHALCLRAAVPNPAHPDPADRGRKHDARHRVEQAHEADRATATVLVKLANMKLIEN